MSAWFHLGADIDNAAPTRGLPDDASDNLSAFIARPNFLMVGTIEPRKKGLGSGSNELPMLALTLGWLISSMPNH